MPVLVSLKSSDDRYYVTAEAGGGREIAANQTVRSDWGMFWMHFKDPINDIIYFMTLDKRFYVTADLNWGGNLVANRTELGPWELFQFHHMPHRQISLQAANGLYVCLENGGNDIVTANRSSRGPWESLYVEIVER